MKICSLFLLIIIIFVTACASQSIATPSLAPTITYTPAPTATLAPATSTIAPTFLPTFSFSIIPISPSNTPIPTVVGGNPFHLAAEIDKIIPGSAWANLQSAQDGNVWLLTDKGVARVSDSGWTVYLSGYEGYIVGIDSTGRVWVISNAGDSISAWNGTKWTKYSNEDGWVTVNDVPTGPSPGYIQNTKTSRFAEIRNQIWVSTDSDVRVFNRTRWTIISLEEMGMSRHTTENIPALPHLEIKVIQKANEVWVGECIFSPESFPSGSGARWFDGNTWRGKSTPVESGCVLAIQEDRAGNIWVGVDYSLWRFTSATQEWVNFTLPELSTDSHSYIMDLDIDKAGEPWLLAEHCGAGGGCASALYRLQDGVWIPFSAYTLDQPREVFIDPADHPWVWTFDKLYRIVDDKPQLIPDLIVDDWTIDTSGRIWVVGKVGQEDKISLWLATP